MPDPYWSEEAKKAAEAHARGELGKKDLIFSPKPFGAGKRCSGCGIFVPTGEWCPTCERPDRRWVNAPKVNF